MPNLNRSGCPPLHKSPYWLGVTGLEIPTVYSLSLVYGVSVHDLLTFAGVAAILLIVSLAACAIPAARAARVDPLVTLRQD